MSELPNGWALSDIGTVCQYIQRGKSPKYDYEKQIYPIINQKCIRWNEIQSQHLKFVTTEFWEGIDDIRFLQKGDILWNSTGTGTIGRAALFKGLLNYPKTIVDSHVTVLRPHLGVDSKYLYYWIQSSGIQNKIEDMQSGTTNQVELSKGAIQIAPIYLAPENEQIRIVKKLDKVLKWGNSAKSHLERFPTILKKLRQSIYNSAITGKFSQNWRNEEKIPNKSDLRKLVFDVRKDEGINFHELFEEDDTFIKIELPDSWTLFNLDKLCKKFTYGSSKKSQKEGKTPVLRMGNLQGGTLDWTNLVYSSDDTEIEKYKLNSGDVLFNRTNSPELVGKTAIFRGEYEAIYAGYLIKISPPKYLNAEYLNMCLNSSFAKKYFWQIKTDGVNQSNINANKLRKVPIPFCSIGEQKMIVEKALELLAITDRSKKNIIRLKNKSIK